MGYRSRVDILFYANDDKDHATLKLYLEENLPQEKFFQWEEIARAQQKAFFIQLEDVKWYESYPDVQKVMEVFRFIDDEVGNSWQYEFVRLGEDDTDVEVRSSNDPQWYLQVVRSVELNF